MKRRIGERGQIILMVGLATIVMFGIVGLAVDVGRLYVTRVELGRSLDVSVLSGILELNGQPSGITNAESKALEYFNDNEPNASASVTICEGDPGPPCNGENNTLTMDATKSINMFFLSVLGIKTASVSAHAKAGFGTQFMDVALVLDSTNSMQGNPITQAKQATEDFKDILLGNNPSGNVGVGFTPFRGCYRADSPYAYAPLPSSKSNCVHQENQVTYLGTDSTLLSNRIDAIDATGGSGTNVCNGLAKGWEILDGSGNHLAEDGNLRFLILLSDGDNNYNGSYAYEDSPYDSPHTYNSYPCRPWLSCTSPLNVGESNYSSNPCEDDTIGTSDVGELDDSSPSSGCGSTNSKRRERQSDRETYEIAEAMKNETEEIIIFVVAFGACSGDSATTYTDAQCDSQIGNADSENIADQRLLKCIASSAATTNDHYFYTNDADDLPGIFTAIANQIAHRLIE
jgi:hypothetical protein